MAPPKKGNKPMAVMTWVTIAKSADGYHALTCETLGDKVTKQTVHSSAAPKNLAVQSMKILLATKIICPELSNILSLDGETE